MYKNHKLLHFTCGRCRIFDSMKGIVVAKMFLLWFILLLAGSLRAAIVIDSASTRPSNCANDGTLTIHARSSSPLLYAIINGPDIRPAQSGNQFGGLPIGTYQVMVTNFANDSAFTNITINGNYVFPDFTPTFTNPICPGSATGTITGNANATSGRPPYTWEITNTNTGVTATQATDTFTALSAGDYRIRQFDSCQSFATRYVTLTNPGTTFTIPSDVYYTMIACDTTVLSVQVYKTNTYWSTPFIVNVYLGGVTKTDTFYPALTTADIAWYFFDTIPGVSLGAGGYLSVTNGCGETVYKSLSIDQWDARAEFYPTTDSCIPRVRVSYGLGNNYFSHTAFTPPITMVVRDVTAGNTMIDSTVSTYSTSFFYPNNYFLEFNHYYSMTVTDGCGNYTQRFFTTPVQDTVSVIVGKDHDACLDSTATVNIHCYNYSPATTWLTILSGPARSRSTKPYFQHDDTIIYPATGFVKYHCSGYSANEVCFGVGSLPAGTYTYRVEDSCGHMKTDTFVIRNENLVAYNYEHSITRGCPGQNKINYVIRSTRSYTMQDWVRLYPLGSTQAIDSINADSSGFANLNAGSYRLEFYVNRYHHFDLLASNLPCNIVTDTIIVLPYQLPRISYATQIKCNGTVNVGLLPDSATGVSPYNYEILSGPQTAPVQADNFFTLTQPGTYVARISDTCGFARTFTFTVDTLSFKQIVQVGSGCAGNTATLTAQHSPYATYVWQRPNGSFYTGDSLRISPVTPSDYGVYHISKIVNVNACRDTFYTTYTLTSNSIGNLYDTICAGRSLTFAGNSYNSTGTYYDTIATATCDSVVAWHLTVTAPLSDTVSAIICRGDTTTFRGRKYTFTGLFGDTVSTASGCDSIHFLNLNVLPTIQYGYMQTICFGDSIKLGSKYYTTNGLYSDTLTATTGCDSVNIVMLTVIPQITTSAQRSICPGQTVIVGTHMYSTTGVYRDTLTAASGCDSILVLNLTVEVERRDSAYRSICPGESITVGVNTYTATGIYADTFTTASGCDSIHILNLTVAPQKTDSVYRTICLGESITVGANTYTATGTYRDTFTTASGCDSIHILNLRVAAYKYDSAAISLCFGQQLTLGTNTYTATGIYRDTFTTATCDSIFVLNLTMLPQIKITVSRSICSGQSITVGTSTYNTTGIYNDTLTAANGCDSIYILTLQVTDVLRDSATLAFCQGDSATLNGQTFTQAGFYTDTINNGFCDSIFTLQVITYPVPSIHITASNVSAALGDTIQLNATDPSFNTYQWSNSVFNNAQITNPVATINQSGWITLQVTDSNNCSATDSIYITVPDCNESIFIPNAFTPNGDGVNDLLHVYGNCIRLNSFLIFNRWGEKVWDSADIEQGWNGFYKDVAQPMAVYVYVVNYSPLSPANANARTLKGSVTLIR